jgi:hypothetical protein
VKSGTQRVREAGAKGRRNFSSFATRMGDRYSQLLEEHPYKTQMVTSGILGQLSGQGGWQLSVEFRSS